MYLVRYAEIGLKGKNRGLFESKLIKNIRNKLGHAKIEKDSGSILVYSNETKKLQEIFGISWFAEAEETGLSLKEIRDLILKILNKRKPKTFRITANRSNKSFPMKSQDLARIIGKECEEKGFPVELRNADLEVFVDILGKRALVYADKMPGLGGLPIGTSGKVLCLLSGGIDSPVAAYLMAKRGCSVDFLHFYALRDEDEVKKSKIPKIVNELERFTGKSRTFLAPFLDFQLAVLKNGEYELQLFRRFMIKLAEEFAKKQGYSAVVLGDNLNQVASQTLENMTSVDSGVSTAVFRPLLTFDKIDIVRLAEKIGTYDFSIGEYKDCCSIIVKKPKTKIKREKLQELEEKISLKSIVEQTFSKISEI